MMSTSRRGPVARRSSTGFLGALACCIRASMVVSASDMVSTAALRLSAGLAAGAATAGALCSRACSRRQRLAGKDDVLLFLCRSGVRSRHAATLATQHGYANSYDILEGFEGDKDAEGHRKTVGGWCKAGLPWVGA